MFIFSKYDQIHNSEYFQSMILFKGTPPLSGPENQNFFDFLVFIDKYTLKCPLSICEKKVSFDNVLISKKPIFEIPYLEKLDFWFSLINILWSVLYRSAKKRKKRWVFGKKIEIKFCFAFFSKSGFLQKTYCFAPISPAW